MSTVSSITGGAGAAGGISALKSEDFLRIILTELGRQDPLQPNDTGALLEQLSTIRSIQSDLDLGKRLESFASQGELATGAGLIGRTVGGLSESRSRVSGVVDRVAKTADGVVLSLVGGARVPLANVDTIDAEEKR